MKKINIYQNLINFKWKKWAGKYTHENHKGHYFVEHGFWVNHYYKGNNITEIHKNDLTSYLKILG